jgi:hypothetical protein
VFKITRKKVTFGETAAMEEEYKNILRKKRRRDLEVPRSSSFSFGATEDPRTREMANI